MKVWPKLRRRFSGCLDVMVTVGSVGAWARSRCTVGAHTGWYMQTAMALMSFELHIR